MSCEKIVICGFSGAGKTSFLRELEFSGEASWVFDDLDQLILKAKRSKTLSPLIEEHGWEKFRLWERQELEGWLKLEGKGVLALGGGTMTQMVFDLYKTHRKIGICYLHAPFEDCWERLHLEGAQPRPLVKLGQAELLKTYQERQKVFTQIPWRLENPKGSDLSKLAEGFWQRVLQS